MYSRRTIYVFLTVAFFLMLGQEALFGGKPTPTPPPPGTVYFCYGLNGGGIWGMNADGSGKFQALPLGCYGMPSSRLYGPQRHRWWIAQGTVKEYPDGMNQVEVFAVRSDGAGGAVWRQLTNVGRQSADDPEFINLGWIAIQGEGWSNDQEDTFVSIEGESARWDADQGLYLVDKQVLRIRLSGAEIEAADQQGVDPKLQADDPLGRVKILWRTSDLSWYNHQTHHWGPDVQEMPDGTLAGTLASQFAWAGGDHLVLMDLATGATSCPCDGGAMDFRLAPVGKKIAIGGGTIATLNYDGTNFGTIATSRGFLRNPCWSLDAAQIVYSECVSKGFATSYSMYRIPATGGTPVLLTKDLSPSIATYPIAWVTNEVVPVQAPPP